MKKFLEVLEDFLLGLISISSTAGFFLIGCFIVNSIAGLDALSNCVIWAIIFASILLFLIVGKLYVEVRYKRLEILAEEYEQAEKLKTEGKLEEACELYEHLRVE